MPRKKAASAELNEALLTPDDSTKAAPRMALGEQGFLGLKEVNGQILTESRTKLRMPNLINEINMMKQDSTIAAALDFYKIMLGRVKWDIKAPVGASAETIERTKFLQTCMNDMDTSWFDTIQGILSVVDYGWCVCEKVYKRRTNKNSKYNAGIS